MNIELDEERIRQIATEAAMKSAVEDAKSQLFQGNRWLHAGKSFDLVELAVRQILQQMDFHAIARELVREEAYKAVREELARRAKKAAKAMTTDELNATANPLLEGANEPQPATASRPDALN